MSHAMEKLISNITGAYLDGLNAGEELQQRRIDRAVAAFDEAQRVDGAQIPLELCNALEGLRGSVHVGTLAEQPKVETVRGASSTEYRISGPLASVLTGIKLVFQQYDPRGYGTRVAALDMDGLEFRARVTRSNSSD